MALLSSEGLINAMNKGELDVHCVDVTISQKCDNALCLKGYGILKVNQVGTIYLEFICRDATTPIKVKKSFQTSYPEDPFDPRQKLYLEAVTLDGDRFFAEEFSVKISVFSSRVPFRLHVFLHEIFIVDEDVSDASDSYLYLEMLDKTRLPPNKVNTEKNSYGEESSTWNEAEIGVGGATVNVIVKKDRTVARAKGEFDMGDLYAALMFYLGLASGVMPQPYCVIKRNGAQTSLYLRSIRTALRGKTIPLPITEVQGEPETHLALLPQILQVKQKYPVRFASAYNQWQQVWHAFQSADNILVLTLGVAIEGLLNDVFIPELQRAGADAALEATKIELVAELKKLNARPDHIETLTKSVAGWGNLHPRKALTILGEKGLVPASEREAWGKLRNKAAHPVFKDNTEANQVKEQQRMARTLTLFYRLILNIFAYDGPMVEFGTTATTPSAKNSYIKILDLAP